MAGLRAANRARRAGPVAALLAATLLACAGGGGEERPRAAAAGGASALAARLAAEPPAPAGALVVRLAFGAEADLDLYVTGPLDETVYFARRESRSGGRLLADRRCGSPEPRVEEVRFERPIPGRYRVGVDHPERCADGEGPVPFAVSVVGPGVEREATGALAAGTFEPLVLELELAPPRRDEEAPP